MRLGRLALLVAGACTASGPTSQAPALVVHVQFQSQCGFDYATLRVMFPPASAVEPAVPRSLCEAPAVVPYPPGTVAGTGTVDFAAYAGRVGCDCGHATFTITDPTRDTAVVVAACFDPGYDAGTGVMACTAIDAGR